MIQRLRKGAAQLGVVCQTRHVARELLIIPSRENIAVFACVDQLGHTADIRADGRAARTDALKDGVREGLGHRGQQVDIHRAEKRLDRRNPAAERHARSHAELDAQLAEHLLILALARDEQAQLGRLFERLGECAHGRGDVLDRSQARGDAAEHVALCDPHAVVLAQVGGAVKIARGPREIHAVVDLDDALGVEPALDQRARHAVRNRLIKIQKPQRDRVRRAERMLLERVAEVVQLVIRVHGRHDRHPAAAAHHRAHQVGAAAVAVDDIRPELVHQVAHRARRAERVMPLDHAHVNAALTRLVRKRARAEGQQHDLVALGQPGHHIHNMGLGAAHVAAAHHMHHSQIQFLQRRYFDIQRQYSTQMRQMQKQIRPFSPYLQSVICFSLQTVLYCIYLTESEGSFFVR